MVDSVVKIYELYVQNWHFFILNLKTPKNDLK